MLSWLVVRRFLASEPIPPNPNPNPSPMTPVTHTHTNTHTPPASLSTPPPPPPLLVPVFSMVQGARAKEAISINQSLSALGDVFLALRGKQAHVPYRNSKLTYLLQPCLGGDGKTLMVVNVNPHPASAHESLCSLKFAERVNQCEGVKGGARKSVSVIAKSGNQEPALPSMSMMEGGGGGGGAEKRPRTAPAGGGNNAKRVRQH